MSTAAFWLQPLATQCELMRMQGVLQPRDGPLSVLDKSLGQMSYMCCIVW